MAEAQTKTGAPRAHPERIPGYAGHRPTWPRGEARHPPWSANNVFDSGGHAFVPNDPGRQGFPTIYPRRHAAPPGPKFCLTKTVCAPPAPAAVPGTKKAPLAAPELLEVQHTVHGRDTSEGDGHIVAVETFRRSIHSGPGYGGHKPRGWRADWPSCWEPPVRPQGWFTSGHAAREKQPYYPDMHHSERYYPKGRQQLEDTRPHSC
mmetsp:Transcript_93922/g.260951  ORF Transcript_93922/g.260951 Transcript_93922/m.260951 type:complete len:205 (+) Transcript_93922:92-706(+)